MDWIKRIYLEEKRKRGEPLEIKKFGRRYYLYTSTTVWDKKEKKRRKISRYIGKITEKGLVKRGETRTNVRSIYEYGNARLLMDVAGEIIVPLKEAFPEEYNEILAMGIIRTIQPTPMRLIKSRWEKFYLSKEIDASLSPNSLSEKLRLIGSDWESQRKFFEYLVSKSKHLLFDLSSLFSYSENLRLAEKGHNADHLYLKQVNFALLFSVDRSTPVMMKAIPGSVRESKSLRHVMKEIGLKSCVIVLDTGFASYSLPDLLKENRMKFILPLRRNFTIIDYDMDLKGCFTYRNRGIKWAKKKTDHNFLYLFEDVKLRAEEETTFIEMIETGKRTHEDFEREKKKFGKIAILSSIDDDGERIYLLLKEREEIEVVFDAMKNEMENDKMYLSDDDAVRGYFFISFISLYLYFRILDMLRQKELICSISVNEVLLEFSKVYLIHYGDGRKRLSEIPARVEKLEEALHLKLFPKELRS